MLRVFCLLGALSFLATSVTAQDDDETAWKLKSTANLNLTQSSFNNAWGGDEVGTLSWALNSNSSAEKHIRPWVNWSGSLGLQFGQTHQQTKDREDWLPPVKSSDKITFRSLLLFEFGGFVEPFGAIDVDSQFFQEDGATGTIRLFTPTTVGESAGIARILFENDLRKVLTRVGVAAKHRIDRLSFNVDANDFETDTRSEAGFEWFTSSRLATTEERSVLTSELRVFKAVLTSADAGDRLHWPAYDVDWQNTLTNKVTEWLAFELYWQILYDKEQDLRGQLKQTLGAGFTWQLI